MARPYIGGTSAGVKTLASTQTLTEADTGKVFICSHAAAYDIHYQKLVMPKDGRELSFLAQQILMILISLEELPM